MVSAVRTIVGDWTDDEIAAVINKVRATTPEELPAAIGRVFEWCAAAQRSGDEEAIATVEIWQMPGFPIEIMVDGNDVIHRLAVDDRGAEGAQ